MGRSRGERVGPTSSTTNGRAPPIDTSLPGAYFADGTAVPGYDDFILIGNRWAQPVTARLTYTRNDGSGTTHDVVVPASSRLSIQVNTERGLAGEEVSMVVQSTDPAHPLDADHSVYWGPSWQSGRSTEGVTPSQTWYFAEGSIGYFDEYLTRLPRQQRTSGWRSSVTTVSRSGSLSPSPPTSARACW